MAPDIAKVNTDRDLNLGLPAWNFSDEVLRWLLHGNSLLLLRRTCSSHLPALIQCQVFMGRISSLRQAQTSVRTHNFTRQIVGRDKHHDDLRDIVRAGWPPHGRTLSPELL